MKRGTWLQAAMPVEGDTPPPRVSRRARLRRLAWLLRPNNKLAFILQLPQNASLFDVGCGNNSAERVKLFRPDIRYVGLDIGDHNQSDRSKAAMDRYLLTSPEEFDKAITTVGESFDAVMSSHNIEHCLKPFPVIEAMCGALKEGGQLYIAFPAEATSRFPSREGTLNFADDPTHVFLPSWEKLNEALVANGMRIDRALRRSRPPLFALAGLLIEPWSAIRRKVDVKGAIWALWGFESIVWASRLPARPAGVAAA